MLVIDLGPTISPISGLGFKGLGSQGCLGFGCDGSTLEHQVV